MTRTTLRIIGLLTAFALVMSGATALAASSSFKVRSSSSPLSKSGRAKVKVQCLVDAGCKGTLRVKHGKLGRIADREIDIPSGRKTLVVNITREGEQAIKRNSTISTAVNVTVKNDAGADETTTRRVEFYDPSAGGGEFIIGG